MTKPEIRNPKAEEERRNAETQRRGDAAKAAEVRHAPNHLCAFASSRPCVKPFSKFGFPPGAAAAAGFTLIELILVMTILTIAVSITAPALANFFRGRSLDSEARRLLALTREGRSRAVNEGLPVELWFNTGTSTFGLEAEPSYEPQDPKAVEFTLDADMQLELFTGTNALSLLPATAAPKPLLSANAAQPLSRHADLPTIRFLPDGSIGEYSPQALKLTGRDGISIWLAQSRNRLDYELRSRMD